MSANQKRKRKSPLIRPSTEPATQLVSKPTTTHSEMVKPSLLINCRQAGGQSRRWRPHWLVFLWQQASVGHVLLLSSPTYDDELWELSHARLSRVSVTRRVYLSVCLLLLLLQIIYMGVVLYAPALALNAGESERFTHVRWSTAFLHSFIRSFFKVLESGL